MSPTHSSAPAVRTGLIVRDTGHSIPLRHVRVEASVADLCARVTVHQSYRNGETMPLEVVYVFPLDEGAAVCGFEAAVDGVRFVGKVMERDEAFKQYDDAMEAGHGGFLLDEERADVFTASLGNVKPGSEVVLSITYVTELAAEGAGARFTLPTTVSPRYAPAEDAAGVGPTPAETLNPPVALEVPYAFEFEMDLAMSGRVRSVTSATHPIEVQQDGARAHVRLAQRSAPMDRDLVIVVAAEGLDVPHAVVEQSERGGAVLVSFVPAFDAAAQPAEVVFVIDRSGSMEGTSIAEVRNALQLCLRSLAQGCRFNIVSFGSSHASLFPESRAYDERSMAEAAAFVGTLAADMGGTELLPALEFVLAQPAVPGLPKQVLLLTDGEVSNTDAVIAVARKHAASARFFTFGIGAGASQHLVRGIARASGGAAEFISPGERIEAKVMRQFKRVFAPALTDVTVDWGQPATATAEHVPPVFNGERMTVYALVDAPKAGTVRLNGILAGRKVTFEVPVDPAGASAGETIATLAARARIRTLEEQGEYLESRGSRQKRARGRSNPAAGDCRAWREVSAVFARDVVRGDRAPRNAGDRALRTPARADRPDVGVGRHAAADGVCAPAVRRDAPRVSGRGVQPGEREPLRLRRGLGCLPVRFAVPVLVVLGQAQRVRGPDAVTARPRPGDRAPGGERILGPEWRVDAVDWRGSRRVRGGGGYRGGRPERGGGGAGHGAGPRLAREEVRRRAGGVGDVGREGLRLAHRLQGVACGRRPLDRRRGPDGARVMPGPGPGLRFSARPGSGLQRERLGPARILIAPSPLRTDSVPPPPFKVPRTCDRFTGPDTVTGRSTVTWPSPVFTSMFALKSAGRRSTTPPSPVLTLQAAAVADPAFAAASMAPSPVWRSSMSKRPSTRHPAVAGRRRQSAVEVACLDGAVAGLEPQLALRPGDRNPAVAGVNVEVHVARDFDGHADGPPAQVEAPVTLRELELDSHLAARLALDDLEVLVDLVANRLDAGLDSRLVPDVDLDAAVPRGQPQVRLACHRV